MNLTAQVNEFLGRLSITLIENLYRSPGEFSPEQRRPGISLIREGYDLHTTISRTSSEEKGRESWGKPTFDSDADDDGEDEATHALSELDEETYKKLLSLLEEWDEELMTELTSADIIKILEGIEVELETVEIPE